MQRLLAGIRNRLLYKEGSETPLAHPAERKEVEVNIGAFPDEMDNLEATDDYYGYDTVSVQRAFRELVEKDPVLKANIPRYWTSPDPREAFDSFLTSGIPDAIINLATSFGIKRSDAVCDLGCGEGHLAWALSRHGFENVSAMDPYADRSGYLKRTAPNIDLISSIQAWKAIGARFNALVSNGVIHHWHHIPLVAKDARKTLKPGGYWFAIQEAYANRPRDLVHEMQNHLTALRFDVYEWFYPASAYVDLVESVGFSLVAVVPFGYRNNELIYPNVARPASESNAVYDLSDTVEQFWCEVECIRRDKSHPQLYTIPQALIFRRVAI
jgi:SAM-dependent methyltransferase